jgi:hypothetical protein
MAMGTRQSPRKQESLWIAQAELVRSPGHSFYQRVDQLLLEERFDEFVESLCGQSYAALFSNAR